MKIMMKIKSERRIKREETEKRKDYYIDSDNLVIFQSN